MSLALPPAEKRIFRRGDGRRPPRRPPPRRLREVPGGCRLDGRSGRGYRLGPLVVGRGRETARSPSTGGHPARLEVRGSRPAPLRLRGPRGVRFGPRLPGRGPVAPRRALRGRPRGPRRGVPGGRGRPVRSRRKRKTERLPGGEMQQHHSILFGPVNALLTAIFGSPENAPSWWLHGVTIGGVPHRRDRAGRPRERCAGRVGARPRDHGAPRLPPLRDRAADLREEVPERRAGGDAERPRGLRRLPARPHQGEHPPQRREVPPRRRGVLLLHRGVEPRRPDLRPPAADVEPEHDVRPVALLPRLLQRRRG